jgi:outer membrane protein assembly factor BamD (BamD/ComL family)
MSSAIAALRKSHEPRVASDLLEHYLSEEPGGPFAEEALGLGIEAAAEGDEPARAVSRARRYLETYPAGRFVAVAQGALRRFPGPVDGAPASSP